MNLSRLLTGLIIGSSALFSACASNPPAAPVGTAGSADSALNENTVAQAESTDYRLGQGDKISIQVFDEPDLTLTATVGSSGGINYSYLGDLRVAGKTAQSLEKHITGLLEDGYLVNPSVNVSIVEFRPFFIGGEVRSPGSYPYQPGLTMDKAIALAGGLTDRASTRQIFIVPAGDTGKQRKAAMNSAVGPGDIVTIKEGFF